MAQIDPYVIPGTRVLKNKVGATVAVDLATIEHELTANRIKQLKEKSLKGKFDYKHLQAIHAHIFQDVYEWAGKPRTIGITKREPLLNNQTVEYPPRHVQFTPITHRVRQE